MNLRVFYLAMALFLQLTCCSQSLRYEGILNDPTVDVSFSQGDEAITASIMENLNHLNLYEYSHVLPELYPLIDEGKITIGQWKNFVDSLKTEVEKHQNDTILPYWAVDYVGLIPLQAQFFVATLDRNEKLNKQYPNAYRILRENTSIMKGLEYRPEDYDSLLVFSEVVGETNFWYFFQLEDCRFVSEVISKDPELIEWYKAVTSSMELTSTYKVPLYLQIRKWNGLQNRIMKSQSALCREAYKPLNKLTIRIEDKNRDFFLESLRDGIDENKLKNF